MGEGNATSNYTPCVKGPSPEREQVEYRYHQYFEFMCEENFVNFVNFLEEQITLYTL